jgi:hypothetical protein
MTKLITAEEAFALSASSKCIDSHIRHINKIIEVACTYGESNTVFDLWHCSSSNAVKIAAHLKAAGYCFRWHEVETNENRTRWYVSWGGH